MLPTMPVFLLRPVHCVKPFIHFSLKRVMQRRFIPIVRPGLSPPRRACCSNSSASTALTFTLILFRRQDRIQVRISHRNNENTAPTLHYTADIFNVLQGFLGNSTERTKTTSHVEFSGFYFFLHPECFFFFFWHVIHLMCLHVLQLQKSNISEIETFQRY